MADARLVDLVHRLTNATVHTVEAGVYDAWSSIEDLSDESGQQAMAQVIPMVGGAQLNVATIQAGYLSQVVGFVMNTPAVATLIADAAWNRSPLLQARRLMAEGAEQDEAIDLAARRAAQVHSGDVFRARRDAVDAMTYGVDPVRSVRWAKVPLPDACSWCRLVATKLYVRADGMPVHLNDRCGLDAVTPADDLSSYTNAGSVFGNTRWRSRVSSQDVADVQRRTSERAAELRAVALDRMRSEPMAA